MAIYINSIYSCLFVHYLALFHSCFFRFVLNHACDSITFPEIAVLILKIMAEKTSVSSYFFSFSKQQQQ